nr:hypothetical protein [Tanacetum cinerariifolium]
KSQPTPRNSAHRGYDKQYASSTKKYPQKHIIPAAVLTKSKLVSVTAARPVSAVVPKIMATKPRHTHSLHTNPNSIIRRHKTRSKFSKTSNSSLKVTVANAKIVSAAKGKKGQWGNPQHALKDKGVIDSGCSRHMIGNMSYLSDFQELNGGYVTFGGNPKGGKITGKGKIKTDDTPKTTSSKTNGNRKRKNRKTCFVYRGVDHLIKDCNFHTKPKSQPTPRNSAHRGYDKQYASSTKKYPQKHIIPAAVLTKSKLVSVTAARPVSAVVPKIMATKPRHTHSLHTNPNSIIRRHKTRSKFSKTSNSSPKVTVANAKIVSAAKGKKGQWGNLQIDLQDKGVIDSGCSRHMTRNMPIIQTMKKLIEDMLLLEETSKERKSQEKVPLNLLLEAVEKRFSGNATTKKTQKNLLKQQYKKFTASNSEMLDQTFDRLQKLMSQLELLGEKLLQEDVNQKLLRSLPPEGNTHAVVWRNKADLETMSMVDLYNNLKVYEPEVKGMSSSNSSTQNMAFVSSSNNSSTNGVVNTAQAVNAAFSSNIDNLSDAVICAFLASQPNSPQLGHEDLEQIHPDDMEEMDLRWQMAMLIMKARRASRTQDNKYKESTRRSVPVEHLLLQL